ncbi:hypothetical protein K490DRAFT_70957 [Saccharata proteae CBS 121410]|uniref:Aminoglycoside phosphotransferase domain-containing protein n=1 Tax=Saccharata proteae CBS 121410 TaxID=1314787 RepID=A0A9P4HZ40_9PEZI|nr:hypothetical protein K490DRAFT_70957 [Saccharata proteae CBS 121410]
MNYHIPIHFDDDVTWLARIRRFNVTSPPPELRDHIIRSEVATLRFLEMTAVPASKVHGFEVEGPGNDVGTGFIVMEKMPGRSLQWSLANAEQREKVMKQLVAIFIELGRYLFLRMGSLDISGSVGPFAAESHTDSTDKGEMQPLGEMYALQPVDAYLIHLFLLDLVPGVFPPEEKEETGQDKAFYLKHADDKGDHVLVDDDHNITAIVDWEWAHTTTRALAFNSPLLLLPVARFYDGVSELGEERQGVGEVEG